MDLEGQGRIKQVVEQSGTDELVAVLGPNSAAAVEMMALTLKRGDPSYAGPLTGIALGIQSYHVLGPALAAPDDRALCVRDLAASFFAMSAERGIGRLPALRDGR